MHQGNGKSSQQQSAHHSGSNLMLGFGSNIFLIAHHSNSGKEHLDVIVTFTTAILVDFNMLHGNGCVTSHVSNTDSWIATTQSQNKV